MSQANVDLVRGLAEDWNRGDWEARWRFHPDVVWIPMRAATQGAYYGIAGIDKFVADTEEMFEKFEFADIDLLDAGERVVASAKIRFKARGSGVETSVETGGVIEIRDGKILRWEDMGSKEAAMAAVGL